MGAVVDTIGASVGCMGELVGATEDEERVGPMLVVEVGAIPGAAVGSKVGATVGWEVGAAVGPREVATGGAATAWKTS